MDYIFPWGISKVSFKIPMARFIFDDLITKEAVDAVVLMASISMPLEDNDWYIVLIIPGLSPK